MHDVGHLPFSHAAEEVLPKGKKHEDISISIILSMEDRLGGLFYKGVTDHITQLIQKGPVLPQLKLLKDIISGNIDADRMDYLIRDSHHCGVDYGIFDYNRLIESLTIIDSINGDGGFDLAIGHGGIHALEALIMARYYMFTQVYYHKTRRIFDCYLKGYMESWKGRITNDNLVDILKYDDIDLTNEIRAIAQDNKYYDYANRICNRKHHSMFYQTTEFAGSKNKRNMEGIRKEMSNIYSNKYDFLIDHCEGSIHKFYVEGDNDGSQEFYVIRNNSMNLLTKESHIIMNIPKLFHVSRLYVDSTDGKKLERKTVEALSKKASEIEKEVR